MKKNSEIEKEIALKNPFIFKNDPRVYKYIYSYRVIQFYF